MKSYLITVNILGSTKFVPVSIKKHYIGTYGDHNIIKIILSDLIPLIGEDILNMYDVYDTYYKVLDELKTYTDRTQKEEEFLSKCTTIDDFAKNWTINDLYDLCYDMECGAKFRRTSAKFKPNISKITDSLSKVSPLIDLIGDVVDIMRRTKCIDFSYDIQEVTKKEMTMLSLLKDKLGIIVDYDAKLLHNYKAMIYSLINEFKMV
jgi:hypothetical protein